MKKETALPLSMSREVLDYRGRRERVRRETTDQSSTVIDMRCSER